MSWRVKGPPPVEFDCEGCGLPVVSFGIDQVPPHGMCAVCAWLSEHEAPEHIMELRRRCEPGGCAIADAQQPPGAARAFLVTIVPSDRAL